MASPLPRGNNREVFTSTDTGPSAAAEMRGMAAPWAALAQAGEELEEIGTRAMLPGMEAKGAEAVVRDPEGNLKVEMRTPLNRLDVAYNHGAAAKYAADTEGDRRKTFSELAETHLDDPVAFERAATAYNKQLAVNAPMELKADVLVGGQREIQQHAEHLFNQKRKRDTTQQLSAIKTGIDTTANDIYALAHNGGTGTPEFAEAVGKLDNQLSQLANPIFGVPPEVRAAQRQEIISGAEAEVVLGMAQNEAVERGVEAGQDLLDKAIWNKDLNLSPPQREAYAARGRRMLNQMEAKGRDAAMLARQEVEYSLDDAAASAEMTGDWTKELSPDQIRRAFPDNPARAADIISGLNAKASIFSTRQMVKNATPADIAAMDARLRPKTTGSVGIDQTAAFAAVNELVPGATITSGARSAERNAEVGGVPNSQHITAQAVDFVLPEGRTFAEVKAGLAAKGLPVSELIDEGDHVHWAWGEKASGFADQMNTYKAFRQAVEERQQVLAKDPAGYVSVARPDIATYLASNDAAMVQTGVRNSLIAQRDLGVTAPRILDEATAKMVVERFANPQDPEKPADNMVGIIGSLEDRYGQYFPQVMAELRKAGMPAEAIALAQVRDDPAVAWRMSKAVNAGRETLRKGITGAEEIDKAVTTGMAAYNRTLAGQNGSAQAASQQVTAAQLYAYQLASEGVKNPGQTAFNDMIGKNYTFTNTYRVPVGVDAAAVSSGLIRLKAELPATAIMPESSIDARLDAATRQRMSAQTLQGSGVWLTLPDDSGVYLAYPQSAGFVPGRRVDGKNITFTWAQVTEAAKRNNQRALSNIK